MEQQAELLVEVQDLVQVYGQRKVLNALSFQLYAGECLGFFGMRDSGKTTLLHILAGVSRFISGQVQVLGCDIRKNQAFKKGLGLVTQEPSLFRDLNVAENLDFLSTLKGVPRADSSGLMERLQLGEYLGEPADSLEAGVYQRLSLACALLNQPRLLILDEPVKDIDLKSRQIILAEVQAYLKDGGSCVCGFSNAEMARYMSRVGWINDGEIMFYSPGEFGEEWQNMLRSLEAESGDKGA